MARRGSKGHKDDDPEKGKLGGFRGGSGRSAGIHQGIHLDDPFEQRVTTDDATLLRLADVSTDADEVKDMISLADKSKTMRALRARYKQLKRAEESSGTPQPRYARKPLVDRDGDPIEPGSGNDDFSDYAMYGDP